MDVIERGGAHAAGYAWTGTGSRCSRPTAGDVWHRRPSSSSPSTTLVRPVTSTAWRGSAAA